MMEGKNPSIKLLLESRRQSWSLNIEPWAILLEVPARETVQLEVVCPEELSDYEIEIGHSQSGLSLGILSPVFIVMLGAQTLDYDFRYMVK
jgi:hypothetical protein